MIGIQFYDDHEKGEHVTSESERVMLELGYYIAK